MKDETNMEFINGDLNDFLEVKKRIEILKVEMKQAKDDAKKRLDKLIEDGERLGVEENVIELLKSMKYK